MLLSDRRRTLANSSDSGLVLGAHRRVPARDGSLPLGNSGRNGKSERPVLRPHILPVVSPAAPADTSSMLERAAATERKELSEGWVLFVGGLVALLAAREGSRRLSRTRVAIGARSASGVDAVSALFLLKEGLHRLGTWALKAPTTQTRPEMPRPLSIDRGGGRGRQDGLGPRRP
jgi:hypothetical protein